MEEEQAKNALILSSELASVKGIKTTHQRKTSFKQFCKTTYKLILLNRTVRIILLPVIILMIISNWAELKIPEYAKNFYECFEKNDNALFSRTMLGVATFTLSHYTVAWIYCCILHTSLYGIKATLYAKCTEEYLGIGYEEYQKMGTGRILTHITRQTNAAAKLLTILVKDVGYDLIFFVFCMASLYSKFGLYFFLVFSGSFIFIAFLVFFASSILSHRKSAFNSHENSASNRCVDIITNYLIIRSYSRTEKEISTFTSSMNGYVSAGMSYEFTLQSFFYFFRISTFFMYFTIIYSCFSGTFIPDMKGSDFLLLHQLFSLYKKRVMALMKLDFELVECYTDLSSSLVVSSKVPSHSSDLASLNDPTITFLNATLLQNGKALINSISLEILPGQKIAVTGRNGSGKSTFIKNILGFGSYRGDVLLCGVQISNINEKALHSKIAYVPQDPHLMNTTVISNLRYGNEGVDEEEVMKICKACGMHSIFKNLTNGYRTVVGENGCNLSGGQAQLVNFMRAVIKDVPIMVLDEPTSNLDYYTSEELLSLIFGYLQHKTVIFSTHNPSHLLRFDKIININQQRANVYYSYEEFVEGCHGRINL